ncbi:MAG TPA: pyrroloquinoline quinone-dependent dehydrogenase, partial [Vicinamibacterales bacterium]
MRRLALAGVGLAALAAVSPKASIEWPYYGADPAGTKYSKAADINRGNVAQLTVAWSWKPAEKPLPEFGTVPGSFENTPLMIDNVLYLSTPYNRVFALDAESGKEIWSYDPHAYVDGQPPNGTGFVHRGVAAWRDHGKLRIFLNSRSHLFCLDAASGALVSSFGAGGSISLIDGLRWKVDPKQYTNTSPPVVYKDLVIVGNGVGDRLAYRQDPPGDVQAFDARTGRRVWIFHTVPDAGEFGVDTWGNDSWKFTGHTNVWAPMTLDERRGLLYLPVSTPSNDFYGGRRPGRNLFADAIVCLDAATGVRKWHFQVVHHGLWDYDMPSPPNLVSIRPEGRAVDAVVQLTKQALVFVFDRVTGKPVWPVEERPVPASDMPGEHAWPTQPFPTKPEPIEESGASEADAFDLTPDLHAKALAELKKLRLGPLYTPPSVQGTLQRPGIIGGANWGGAAFDPATGHLFVKTSNQPHVARLGAPDRSPDNPRASEVDADYTRVGDTTAEFATGIPLLRPPYAHLTAIDLNRGAIAWRVPFGDSPQLRQHPALMGVALREPLGAPGAPGVIVTAGGLVFVGGGDGEFHAYDTESGRELWKAPLPRR